MLWTIGNTSNKEKVFVRHIDTNYLEAGEHFLYSTKDAQAAYQALTMLSGKEG